MNTAKPVKNADTRLHQQEWLSDFSESSMGCAISQLMIEKALNYCVKASVPRLIGIEGVAGSGKTLLANALADNLDNALLIDLYSLKHEQERINVNKMATIQEMTDENIIYIIDETGYCNLDHLADAVKIASESNCTVILFFQSFEEVPKSMLKDLQCFNLSFNNGLIRVKTH